MHIHRLSSSVSSTRQWAFTKESIKNSYEPVPELVKEADKKKKLIDI